LFWYSIGFRFPTIGWDYYGYYLMGMCMVGTLGMVIPILWSMLKISSAKMILAPIQGEQVKLVTDLLDRVAATTWKIMSNMSGKVYHSAIM
jgi:hypothetical protein